MNVSTVWKGQEIDSEEKWRIKSNIISEILKLYVASGNNDEMASKDVLEAILTTERRRIRMIIAR